MVAALNLLKERGVDNKHVKVVMNNNLYIF